MNYYELNYLVSPDISEEEAKSYPEKIITLIQAENGMPDFPSSERIVLKKRLAYPINKKDSAYVLSLSFLLHQDNLPSLEKKLKEDKNILRYFILRKKQQKISEKREIKRPELAKKPEEKKVDLQEVEKKLEEILKDNES